MQQSKISDGKRRKKTGLPAKPAARNSKRKILRIGSGSAQKDALAAAVRPDLAHPLGAGNGALQL